MQIGGGRSLTSQERKELEDLKNLEPDYSLAPKPKEIDEFKFPNLPNIIQLDKWYQSIKRQISSGSHNHKQCMKWISVVDIASSWEELEYSGIFENLDAEIATTLIYKCYGEFGREISLLEKQLAKTGNCLSGRQVLWLIVNTRYRVNATLLA